MNMGQTMITSGFFLLLVMSVISANRMLISSAELLYEGEAYEHSLTIAEEIFAEAASRLFDVYDNGTGTQNTWEFTWSLGPSSSEASFVRPLPDRRDASTGLFRSQDPDRGYNDFDDFNGYSRLVDIGSYSGFHARVQVYYVDEYDPNVVSYWQTYFKRMDVIVKHPVHIKDSVVHSMVMTY